MLNRNSIIITAIHKLGPIILIVGLSFALADFMSGRYRMLALGQSKLSSGM